MNFLVAHYKAADSSVKNELRVPKARHQIDYGNPTVFHIPKKAEKQQGRI